MKIICKINRSDESVTRKKQIIFSYMIFGIAMAYLESAIVLLESVDAIRVLMFTIKDGSDSISITIEAIGLHQDILIR